MSAPLCGQSLRVIAARRGGRARKESRPRAAKTIEMEKRGDEDRVKATARCIGDVLNAVGITRHPLTSVISPPIRAGGVSSLSQFQPPGASLHNLLIIMDEARSCSNEEGNFHR
jgi:hypothetical protein